MRPHQAKVEWCEDHRLILLSTGHCHSLLQHPGTGLDCVSAAGQSSGVHVPLGPAVQEQCSPLARVTQLHSGITEGWESEHLALSSLTVEGASASHQDS